MGKATRATAALQRAGIRHLLHPYTPSDDADTYGEAVAAALGVDPSRLFKTLVAVVDANPVVAIVPASQRLSLKALARAAGGKRADMADTASAERITGYVVGGISPFGQKKRLPVHIDETALGFETVFVSAGMRGLQVEVAPAAFEEMLSVTFSPLTE